MANKKIKAAIDAKVIKVGVELDTDTDAALGEWADLEGRSKRGHGAWLLRRLVLLRRSHPAELQRLGLLSATAV